MGGSLVTPFFSRAIYNTETMPLRIAILTCDTPVPEANRRYNGYGGVFRSLLKSSAKVSGLDPEADLETTVFDIVDGEQYPELESMDAVLLTGSKYNSYDDTPWILRLLEFTQKVLAQDRVRILGICFGHQIVGRALGSKVGRSDRGWEISVCDMALTDKGKELFGRDKLRIQQMHQDIVFSIPPNVTLLGSSPRCEVQGMYAPRRFITVQGHPEFTEDIVKEIVKVRTQAGVFKDDFAQDALDRAGNEHDGVAIAAVFLKFLSEE
ncbi:Glutamine amidotransferase type 1 [Penicillium brevicompactum]|uniref:Glutamine amidotransferase type 1 n=1 Tax=Penicillium brevicompactum TaxID=5074 RepID=A0A9W9QM55_PENBR|nr:Glutamine amidotransferase type 1 [Penicillium brevicompactum]